jgi:hypothetical protein
MKQGNAMHASRVLSSSLRRRALGIACAAAVALAPLGAARAQSGASEASALSLLPIAVSVAAPALLFVGGATLTVVSVEASANGTLCVLERASDGARASLRLSAQTAGALSLGVGSVVLVTALGSGWLLSAAGQALAFIPNEIGAALLHDERISR